MHSIRIGSLPDNDLVFEEPMVSGYHAEIFFEDGQLILVDLESTNGTFVSGEMIEEQVVEPGQEIGLGSFYFRLTQAHLRPLYEKVMASRERRVMASPTAEEEPIVNAAAAINVVRSGRDDEDEDPEESPTERAAVTPSVTARTFFEDVQAPKASIRDGVQTVFEDPEEDDSDSARGHAATTGLKLASERSSVNDVIATFFEDESAPSLPPRSTPTNAGGGGGGVHTLFEEEPSAPLAAGDARKPSDNFTLFEAPAVSPSAASLKRTIAVGDLKRSVGDKTHVRAITIGYDSSNNLVLPLAQVSGYHARITQEDDAFLITDLQSTNGTYVNGERVDEPTALKKGDLIGLGSYSFDFDDELLELFDEADAERAVFDPSRWVEGDSTRLTIGRAEDNDIVIPAPQVSGHHAELRLVDADHWYIVDLGSLNGTFVNVRSTPVPAREDVLVSTQDVIYLGSYRFPMSRIGDFQVAKRDDQSLKIPEGKEVVTIGRGENNDLVINAAQISREHAILRKQGDGWVLEDCGSANGTFVNGERVETTRLISPQDIVGFGSYILRLDPAGGVIHKEYQGEIMLRAEGVSVDVKDPKAPGGTKRILDNINFTAYPTEFIGLMGPSGAGKTTLMMALNGYLVPSEGQSLINDLDLYQHYNSFRGNIGYVPQDDIIHPELTVFESLYFTAKLRLPPDTDDGEIEGLIDRILSDLGIAETKHVLIGSPLKKGISGGQRKRVNLAQELITQPSLLFLDEPTSGLASSDTRGVMKLLRRLADEGRTILLTIHQPSLEVYREMDNVLYLARGKLVYYGPTYPDSIAYFNPDARPGTPAGDRVLSNPDEAMEPLAVDNAANDCMARIEARREAYSHSKYYRDYVSGRRAGESKVDIRSGTKQRATRRFGLRQWWTLTRRTFTIKRKDVVNSAILLLQAPIIAVIVGVVFDLVSNAQEDPLSQFATNRVSEDIHLSALFMLVASSVWFGTSNSAREIVSELAIYRRERMVNLKIPSYVMSKFTVLSLLSLVQCATLLGITYSWLGFHGSFMGMLGVLFLCSTAGLGIGLVLSAMVRSSEAAVALVPLLLIPQMLLGGLIVPVEKLDGDSARTAVRYGANMMIARWGFEGILHLEEESMPLPAAIEPSKKAKAEMYRRVFEGQEVILPPPPRRYQIDREKFESQARAFFIHYQAQTLDELQAEVRPLKRYFGGFGSSLGDTLLVLLIYNGVLLVGVCVMLRIKDVEV